MIDNTKRFSERVDAYVRSRPGYPVEVLDHLAERGFLFDGARIADVGAGTGILTRILLDEGYEVWAVEPNEEMRLAAEEASIDEPRFHSVDGRAEATTLPDGTVDLVAVAQALHWFSPDGAGAEFRRITAPPHRLAAIWNKRNRGSTEFLKRYEELLVEYGPGYNVLMEGRGELEDRLEVYFGHRNHEMFRTFHERQHDWDGLVARLMSSSYGPKPDHPNHEPMIRELREIFDAQAEDGEITMMYETRCYFGEMTG